MEDQNPEVIRESANKAEEDVEDVEAAEESDEAQGDDAERGEEGGGQQVLPETDLGESS